MAGIPDLLNFLPLTRETIETIRSRIDTDANAGLKPGDPEFKDTTVGGLWWDITQAVGLEIERLYDLVSTELAAVMFPQYAWGEYLDDHGVTINVTRKAEVKATGQISFSGTVGALVAAGTRLSTEQTDPDQDPVEFVTTASGTLDSNGTLVLPVEAAEAGAGGNVSAASVTNLLSPIAGIASVSNGAAMSGGADIESDDLYRQRILTEWAAPHGAGAVPDYERWALSYAPVGYVTVIPLWNGPGTVKVVVTDQSNNPVSQVVIDGLQALLDPVPGQGAGLAPIGATVTVDTPTIVLVPVTAAVSFDTGYSLTGTGSTVAVQDDITTTIQNYINTLAPGADVVKQEIAARIIQVQGVYDVTVSAPASNVAIGTSEVARTGLITLS